MRHHLSESELRDGRVVQIRPIAASDDEALVRFHEGLSLETTRLRFFGIHPHLTPGEVDRFTHVDHHDREGLVVLDDQDIIGVGRYDRSPGRTDAEVAFVVADSWQGLGIASILLAELVQRARPQGIDHFVADTLGENHRMQDVLRHSGRVVESAWDCGVVRVVLDLAPPPRTDRCA